MRIVNRRCASRAMLEAERGGSDLRVVCLAMDHLDSGLRELIRGRVTRTSFFLTPSRQLLLPEHQTFPFDLLPEGSGCLRPSKEGAERRKGANPLFSRCAKRAPALRSAGSPRGAPPRRFKSLVPHFLPGAGFRHWWDV